MAQNPKDGKLLYHLTALKNLESIIVKGLQPRKYIKNFIDIADEEILKDREKFELGLYTPFHFFPGSSFAGVVQKSNIDEDFVFITIKRELAERNDFKIIPSHPLNFQSEPLSWKEGIERIDWELMNLRDYSHLECKEVCMAESIFKGHIPANCFNSIAVKNNEVGKNVRELFIKYNCSGIYVDVIPGMFVNHD